MLAQQRTHDIALHSESFAVNQADFAKARLYALFEIFFDDAWNVFRLKGVEIDGVLDRNDDRLAKR